MTGGSGVIGDSGGFAPAKVNLFLHVGATAPDGYHPVSSLIVFARDAGDRLEAAPADTLRLALAGPEAAALGPSTDDNLVLRAARALADAAKKEARAANPSGAGAHLTLHKSLPVASGIGGGSADAAAALRLLNRLWGLDWPPERLLPVAATLGADVPACLLSRPVLAEGRGERIRPLETWPDLHCVLVNPRIPLSTAAVFAAFDRGGGPGIGPLSPPFPQAFGALSAPDPAAALALIAACRNDLQPSALALVPQIGDALAALEAQDNCLLARMSGSGATCFGLYGGAESAARARASIARTRPDWWALQTVLGGTGF